MEVSYIKKVIAFNNYHEERNLTFWLVDRGIFIRRGGWTWGTLYYTGFYLNYGGGSRMELRYSN